MGGIYEEVCDRLRACIQTGQRPLEIMLSVMHRYDLTLDVAKALFSSVPSGGVTSDQNSWTNPSSSTAH